MVLSILLLPCKTYGAGVFRSAQTHRGKDVKGNDSACLLVDVCINNLERQNVAECACILEAVARQE
jgi:hypothetical protein